MKDIEQFIRESEEADNKIRAKIIFTIWESPGVKVSKLASPKAYNKIECKYEENDDAYDGIKVDFLLGLDDKGFWQLWAGKIGVVSYADDPYADTGESDFSRAVMVAVDKCVELIKQIKKEPNNWVQYYTGM